MTAMFVCVGGWAVVMVSVRFQCASSLAIFLSATHTGSYQNLNLFSCC